PKPECEACSITDDMVTEHASFIKLFDNEENVKGLMKSVAKLIKLLGKDVSVDMVKGYIIGAGGSSDDEDAAQGIYDLIQSSGKCIATHDAGAAYGMENDDKESHLASAVHGVTHPDAHDEQLSDALERLAALESQHTIPELVRKVIGLLKEWRSGIGRDKQAAYINVRGDAHDKGKVKSNLRRLKKHIVGGRIDSLFVSITATNHPVPALHDAIEALKSVAPVWTGIARLELEIVLTSHSRLEMIRSIDRYQASLGSIFKSITALLPGPLEFVATD
ncbi:hypothetical protein IWQ56_004095, partial [Coemansia nantahalensis]